MGGLVVYLSEFFRHIYLENLEQILVNNAELVSDGLFRDVDHIEDYQLINSIINRLSSLMDIRVTIIKDDGTVINETYDDINTMNNHANRPEVIDALRDGKGSSIRYSATLGYKLLYVAIYDYISRGTKGIVRVGIPLDVIDNNIKLLQNTLIGIAIIATLFALSMGIIIAELTTKPIRQLTWIASELAESALNNQPIPLYALPATKDEIGELADAFNVTSTQLHRQIEALEGEQKKISAVLKEMTDGVIIVDNTGTIQLINPAIISLLNINISTPIGSSIAEVLRHHQFVELWRHARKTREHQSTILELSSPRLYLHCNAIPLDHVLPGSTLLLIHNLTRQRYLETVRQDFISNLSHELRTPIASLKALTETLQQGALEDTAVAKRFLQQMETEVDALGHMVLEFLELSRIESGQVPLKLATVSPYFILKQANDRLQIQAERSGLTIDIDCPPDLPDVLADLPRIEQAVVNLLHNSIKFTPSGGRITLRAAHQSDMVIISIIDTGIGIHPDDLPRIFERFFKADRARAGGGTGLGLAIARHMVEAHGGKIWATSIEYQGSTFSFSIPIVN